MSSPQPLLSTVTARQLERLRASEQRFRYIVEAAQEGVLTTDADGVITFANRRVAELLGYGVEEMLGRRQDAFFADGGLALLATDTQPDCRSRPASADVELLHRDGTAVWAQVARTTLYDGDGHEAGGVVMIADITERRQAEAERARLAAIVTSSDDAIFSNTLDGIITDWNGGAERLYGYRPDEIVGRSALCLAPPELVDEIRTHLKRLTQGERIERLHTVRLRKDGSRIEVAVSLSPISDDTGHITAAAVIVRDITPEMQAVREGVELAREQASHAEAESARKREAFLADASRCLAGSLDYEATLRGVAALAVPTLADYCQVYLTNEQGELLPVALSHVDPTKEVLLRAVQHRYARDRDASGGLARVLRTGQSVLYAKISPRDVQTGAPDPAHAAMLQALGARSAIIVALAARGRSLGAMSFRRSISDKPYTPDDLVLAEDLARRCAQAIDNARLYQAAQHEITERRKIEGQRAELLQQIEQERATLAGVMGSMSDGLLVLDTEGRVVYSNVQAGQLLRLEPGLIGAHASKPTFLLAAHLFGSPEGAPSTWQDALARLEDRPTLDLSLPGPPASEMQLRLFPVAGGLVSGGRVGVLVQDVTAERELQRARDDLVSMVSHELASPVTNLVACAELLGSGMTAQPPAEHREVLATMVTEGQRLDAIIRDFLDIRRLEKHGMLISARPSDLRALLEHAARLARRDPDHRLVVDVEEHLPLVQVDPDRVQQVLANLLSNARKYTPSGGEIRLAARRVDGAVELSVADDGQGVPAEALPHLFEKFYRVASHERRGIKGTGLGLAIVKELVEAQGGRVGVESAGDGHGLRFWFRVPFATSRAQQAEADASPIVSTQAAGTVGEHMQDAPKAPPLRVLVVDDDRAVGSTVTRVLRLDRHSVTAATSAEEALRCLQADRFDVVVSDLRLGPGLNGLGLAQQIRKLWPNLHFVLASGTLSIDRAAARIQGVDAFLQKPYRPQELRDVLAQLGPAAAHKAAAA